MSRQSDEKLEKGSAQPIKIAPFNPYGNHVSVILSATVSYSAQARPKGASLILVQAITQNIRFRLDGVAPTTTVGFQIVKSDPAIIIPIGSNSRPMFIAETAGAVLQYQWGD